MNTIKSIIASLLTILEAGYKENPMAHQASTGL